jgi:hypothetical protein
MCVYFGVSTELGQLGLFCFNMACAFAPLVLAPFCELVGRRVTYVGAYALFVIVFIELSLGKNIATILVMQVFQGLLDASRPFLWVVLSVTSIYQMIEQFPWLASYML